VNEGSGFNATKGKEMSFKEFDLAVANVEKKNARLEQIKERQRAREARNALKMAAERFDAEEALRQDVINRIAARRASQSARLTFEESFEGEGKRRKRILTFSHEARREAERTEWNQKKNSVLLTGAKIEATQRPYGKPSAINTSAILELQFLRQRVADAKQCRRDRQAAFLKARMELQGLAFEQDCDVDELVFFESLKTHKTKPTKVATVIDEVAACQNAVNQVVEFEAELSEILRQIEI